MNEIISISKQTLEDLFKVTKPYIIEFEYRTVEFRKYRKALNMLITEEKVKLISKSNTIRTYEYVGQI